MEASSDRSVHQQHEPPPASLRVAVPRSASDGRRRPLGPVAHSQDAVSLPAEHLGGSSAAKGVQREAVPAAPGHPRPSGGSIVSSFSAASPHQIGPSTSSGRGPRSAALEPCSSGSGALQASPLVCQFSALRRMGFSEAVLQRMRRARASSTNKAHLLQWRLFDNRCLDGDLGPVSATSPVICEFLVYLFRGHVIQVRSILGYRSAIAYFLKRTSGYELSSCAIIADLIKGFKQDRRGTLSPWKSVFLFSLAAGKRRSVFHALQRVCHLCAAGRVYYRQTSPRLSL